VPPPWCERSILPSCNIVLRFTCTHLCLVDTLPLQRTFHPGEQFGIVLKLLSDYRLFLCVHSLLTVPDILWPNFFCRWRIIMTAWQLWYCWQRNDFTALLLGAITLPYNRHHLLRTCQEPSTASWCRTRSRQPSEMASFTVAKVLCHISLDTALNPVQGFPLIRE